MKRIAVSAALASLLFLAACGGGGGSWPSSLQHRFLDECNLGSRTCQCVLARAQRDFTADQINHGLSSREKVQWNVKAIKVRS